MVICISNKHACLPSSVQFGSHLFPSRMATTAISPKRSQMLHVLHILIEKQCVWWICSVCPHHDIVQFCCCGNDFTPTFPFILLVQSCLYNHSYGSHHQSWYFPFNNSILLVCPRCSKFKDYTQVLFVSLFLETSVFSTVIKPDSLHLNTILAEQNLNPLWYHSNLVTYPCQKEAVTPFTELIHCNQLMSHSTHTFMFERTDMNKYPVPWSAW